MKIVIIIFAVIILVLLSVLLFVPSVKGPTISNVPSVVLISPDGHVRVVSPVADTIITSPVIILGTVTAGGWFFEGSFPVKILDGDGTVLGKGSAVAQGDWMATGTVPFSATINFSHPNSATGTIVFAKDNPSCLPQNAESFSMPVNFH